jgi:hypothetical protein
MNGQKNCGCGRSPTGQCVGWHALSEEAFAKAKSDYEFEQYLKRAENLWFKEGSCTGGNRGSLV